MMHEIKIRVPRVAAALLVGLATLGSAGSASGSSKFPEALQKALTNKFPGVTFCVPLCTTCHLTMLGGFGTLNIFGDSLAHQPMSPNLVPGNGGADTKVKEALDRYFAAAPAPGLKTAITVFPPPDTTRPSYDVDGDGVSDYDELRQLDSPSTALPGGVGEFCPSDVAMYGCFARVAAAPPPVDRVGLLSAGLVVLGLTAFRRLKRKPRTG